LGFGGVLWHNVRVEGTGGTGRAARSNMKPTAMMDLLGHAAS